MNVFRENLLLTDQTARECTCHKNFTQLYAKKRKENQIFKETRFLVFLTYLGNIPWKYKVPNSSYQSIYQYIDVRKCKTVLLCSVSKYIM